MKKLLIALMLAAGSLGHQAANAHDAFAIIAHIFTYFRISAAEFHSGFFA